MHQNCASLFWSIFDRFVVGFGSIWTQFWAIVNIVWRIGDTSNNIENAMAMQPAPSAMVAPVQLGRDGINPASVFNPPPLSNDQIIANEQQRVTNVMGQLGPTREKANLNLNPIEA
mgnify:CR=1 FL=1